MINTNINKIKKNAEIKPNITTSIAMIILMLFGVACLILNEVGIFYVNKVSMRIGVIFLVLLTLYPILCLTYMKDCLARPKTKYLLISCSICSVFILTTFLSFHVTLLILFPLMIATQYSEKKICYLGIAGSLICCVLPPLIGYLITTWDYVFLSYLIGFYSKYEVNVIFGDEIVAKSFQNLIYLFIYLVLPRVGIILPFSYIISKVVKKNKEHIESQIKIIELNELDALTGLYNRNTYEQNLPNYNSLNAYPLSVIYLDLNYLHQINNSYGHEKGDEVLKNFAKMINDLFPQSDIYRFGGDEFIVFEFVDSKEQIQNKINELRTQIKDLSFKFSFSVGYQCVNQFDKIDDVIRNAEKEMFQDKINYYEVNNLEIRNEQHQN